MNKAIKSRHYAKALLDLAEKEQALETVYAQIGPFVAAFRQIGALKALLITARVTPEQKEQLLARTFGDNLHPILLTFVLQLAERRDLKLLQLIAFKAEQLYRSRKNSVKVTATTSSALSETQLKQIREQVVRAYGKQPDLETVIDPEIIGGLRLRVGNTVIDGSLASRLGQLKKNLIQS